MRPAPLYRWAAAFAATSLLLAVPIQAIAAADPHA